MAEGYIGKVAVRFKGYKFSDDTVYTFRYSNLGFVVKLGDDSSDQFYEPFVHDAIVLDVEQNKTNNKLSINLANDSTLDDLIDYNFKGYELDVYISSNAAPNPYLFYHVYTGTIDKLLVQRKKVKIDCLSQIEILKVPVNPAHFTGVEANYEGDTSLTDQIKPRVIGRCFNIKPRLIHPTNLVYGCNWDVDGDLATIYAIDAVRDGGIDLTLDTALGTSGNYTTTALMDVDTPAAGKYTTCLADGTFKLGTRPHNNYDVTIDVREKVSNTYSDWLDTLVSELSFTGKVVLSTSTYEVGYYCSSATNYDEVDNHLKENLDLFTWFTSDGKVNLVKMRDNGVSTPVTNFAEAGTQLTDVDDIAYYAYERTDYELPYKDVTLKYGKNFNIQGQESIAAGVTDENDRELYSLGYSDLNDTNVCTTDPYLMDNAIELDTAIYGSTDATTELAAWISNKQYLTDYLIISCPILSYNSGVILGALVTQSITPFTNISDDLNEVPYGVSDDKTDVIYGVSDNNSSYIPQAGVDVGAVVTLTNSRFDYTSHRFIIYGYRINTRKMTIEYKLKGFRTASECT